MLADLFRTQNDIFIFPKSTGSFLSYFNPQIVDNNRSSEEIFTETVCWVPLVNPGRTTIPKLRLTLPFKSITYRIPVQAPASRQTRSSLIWEKIIKKSTREKSRYSFFNIKGRRWGYSGMGLLGIDGIRVLLGAIPFSERTEYHSVHSAPDSRMNGMNGIRFTRNTQNTRSFGKFLPGNTTWPPAPVVGLQDGRRSSSLVTSALSIPFSEWMSVLLEIETPCILLLLNQKMYSQNMHP